MSRLVKIVFWIFAGPILLLGGFLALGVADGTFGTDPAKEQAEQMAPLKKAIFATTHVEPTIEVDDTETISKGRALTIVFQRLPVGADQATIEKQTRALVKAQAEGVTSVNVIFRENLRPLPPPPPT